MIGNLTNHDHIIAPKTIIKFIICTWWAVYSIRITRNAASSSAITGVTALTRSGCSSSGRADPKRGKKLSYALKPVSWVPFSNTPFETLSRPPILRESSYLTRPLLRFAVLVGFTGPWGLSLLSHLSVTFGHSTGRPWDSIVQDFRHLMLNKKKSIFTCLGLRWFFFFNHSCDNLSMNIRHNSIMIVHIWYITSFQYGAEIVNSDITNILSFTPGNRWSYILKFTKTSSNRS